MTAPGYRVEGRRMQMSLHVTGECPSPATAAWFTSTLTPSPIEQRVFLLLSSRWETGFLLSTGEETDVFYKMKASVGWTS